jgi:hypothetical protein
MSLQHTIGDENWLKTNENAIKALFPETWTNIQNLNGTKLGSDLKALGIEWRSQAEFEMLMVFFEKMGFALREGKKVKRNQNPIF